MLAKTHELLSTNKMSFLRRQESRTTMKKRIALSLGALALVAGTTYLATNKVSAFMGNGNVDENPMVQKLAERFGLNQDELKSFFEEEREAHQEKMQAQFEERLNQAVADGKITEAQKQLILQKHEELRAARQENREEKQEDRETRRAELEAWAKEKGIDMKFFSMGGGPKEGRGIHRMGQ